MWEGGVMSMGEYIRKQRVKRGYSQSYVAEGLQITRQTYMKLESGGKDATIEQLKVLSGIFSMPFEDLAVEKVPQPKSVKKMPESEAGKTPGNNLFSPGKITSKFTETFLHVTSRISSLPESGESALCTILYLTDRDYYIKYGKHLTGIKYLKTFNGPYPENFNELVGKMINENLIVCLEAGKFKFENKKYLPVRRENEEMFSAGEYRHIEQTISRYGGLSSDDLLSILCRDKNYLNTTTGAVIRIGQ
jgi:DNA-binding XRE family transcriptional regulator